MIAVVLFRHMTEEQRLAWGELEAQARARDLLVPGREGLIQAQKQAEIRRQAVGATKDEAAQAVLDAIHARPTC